jgi:hypothetical protein
MAATSGYTPSGHLIKHTIRMPATDTDFWFHNRWSLDFTRSSAAGPDPPRM